MTVKTEGLDWVLSAKDNASSVFREVDSAFGKLEKSYEKVAKLFAAGFAIGIFGEIAHEASKAEEASNRLNAVLRATGFAGGLTKRELDDMADSLAHLTQFEDESVRAAEAVLLKFGNIQEGVFREALKLSADYAAFTGGDMASAAQAVGKALQSPTEGLKSLQAEMGKLSPTQRQTIDRFLEMNDLAGAQGVVLDFVREKIAGTAAIMNTGYLGATTSVKKSWEEFLESMGRSPLVARTAGVALHVVESAVKALDDSVKALSWENLKAVFTLDFRKHEKEDPERETARRGAAEAKWRDQYERYELETQKFARDLDDKRTKEMKRAAEERAKAEKDRLAQEARNVEQAEQLWMHREAAELHAVEETNRAMARIDEEREARQKAAEAHAEDLWMHREAAELRLAGEIDEKLRKAVDKTDDVARQLGLTFSSAFEDAGLKGKGFRDVLHGIEQDIARIIFRKSITEPLAGAVSDWAKDAGIGKFFKDLFGGGKALGGPVSGGTPYLVGERGPELFVPGASGTIVPNGAGMGPVNLNVTMNVHSLDARSTLAAVAPLRSTFIGWVNQAFNERGRAGPLGR